MTLGYYYIHMRSIGGHSWLLGIDVSARVEARVWPKYRRNRLYFRRECSFLVYFDPSKLFLLPQFLGWRFRNAPTEPR